MTQDKKRVFDTEELDRLEAESGALVAPPEKIAELERLKKQNQNDQAPDRPQ
jgi:hypothetical protein